MEEFIKALKESEYGMAVRYAAGAYTAYVREDEEEGGYSIAYCQGMMPPHDGDHAETAEEAARMLAEIADLSSAYPIEPDYE